MGVCWESYYRTLDSSGKKCKISWPDCDSKVCSHLAKLREIKFLVDNTEDAGEFCLWLMGYLKGE